MQVKHLAGRSILIVQCDCHETEVLSEMLTRVGAIVRVGMQPAHTRQIDAVIVGTKTATTHDLCICQQLQKRCVPLVRAAPSLPIAKSGHFTALSAPKTVVEDVIARVAQLISARR